MNHLFKPLSTLIVFSLLFLSCDREKESIPSYLHISKFTFTTNPNNLEGLNTAEIISAKVFVNGKEMGNYELPATFPVIAEGICKVEIFPNVKENASSYTQKYYRVYNAYIDTLELKPGRIDTIHPSSTYRSNCTFRWMEDFEDQAISLQVSGGNNTDDTFKCISTSTPGVNQPFTGSNFCGYIEVGNGDSAFLVFERSTAIFSNIPFLGTDVYVEMDIKTNVAFQVGVYEYYSNGTDQNPVVVVNPTGDNWKKIYVNLKTQIGDLPSGTNIRLFFGFYKEEADLLTKKVYIDNLKLVYVL